jgi:ribosome-binding protein aMBF1 (putative translation factor)
LTVEELRKEKGWSQTKLANEAGVDWSTVKSVEDGEHSPTVKTVRKLADALDVEVGEIIEDV